MESITTVIFQTRTSQLFMPRTEFLFIVLGFSHLIFKCLDRPSFDLHCVLPKRTKKKVQRITTYMYFECKRYYLLTDFQRQGVKCPTFSYFLGFVLLFPTFR